MFDFGLVDQQKRAEEEVNKTAASIALQKRRAHIDSLRNKAKVYFSDRDERVDIRASEQSVTFQHHEYGRMKVTALDDNMFEVDIRPINEDGDLDPVGSGSKTKSEVELTRAIVDWLDGESSVLS